MWRCWIFSLRFPAQDFIFEIFFNQSILNQYFAALVISSLHVFAIYLLNSASKTNRKFGILIVFVCTKNKCECIYSWKRTQISHNIITPLGKKILGRQQAAWVIFHVEYYYWSSLWVDWTRLTCNMLGESLEQHEDWMHFFKTIRIPLLWYAGLWNTGPLISPLIPHLSELCCL